MEHESNRTDAGDSESASRSRLSLPILAAAVIANTALGTGVGWACGWLLQMAGQQNSLLPGVAIIPLMAVGLFGAVATAYRPLVAGVVFLPVMAITMFVVIS